ncbi:MAG: RsmD family RNA methyltransferase [Spirochaetaceae bacterium]|jgi:16S rRNA (guanine(966)-N(2))-methyltransferase RsmD|nr:RsmD family RNA methyltransferase [Spirochaetaceae bacterium]
MRITGGALVGHKVAVPPGIIRPAMDKMRESIFSILGNIEEKSFLDLFSGSLIIALEASSRGSRPIEAVEKDKGKRPVILLNAALSQEHIHCHFMPVELYIKRAGAKEKSFDYIFCDPPFPYKFKQELLEKIAGSKLMRSGSLLLLHRPSDDSFDQSALEAQAGLVLNDRRVFGRSVVDFWMKK